MFASYARVLDVVLRHRVLTITVAFGLLGATVFTLWPVLRREFFPEVDAGAFEMYVRAPSGTADRGDRGADRRGREVRPRRRSANTTCELVICEIGVTADWSAAYTPNAGPMDAVVKVQLTERPEAVGPGVRPPDSARAFARTRGSATWSSPSTPAA